MFFFLWIALFILICFVFTSCSVLQKSGKKYEAEGNVKKEQVSLQDSSKSGGIKKSNIITKEDADWWKTTLQFPKDTSKATVNNIYPSTIIYEGGKSAKETNQNNFDSNWIKNAISSLNEKIDSTYKSKGQETSSKKTETKLGWLEIGLAFLIYTVLTKGIGYFTSNFKIIRHGA